MWGSKKKKSDDEDNRNNNVDTDFNQFELKQKLAAAKFERKMKPNKGDGSESFGKLRELVNMYISSMEDFLESPQFSIMVNPASIQALVEQVKLNIPGDNPEVSNMLEMFNSMDAEQLKFQIKLGLQYIKTYIDQMETIASDPDQLDAALSQFPGDTADIIKGFMKGDLEPFKSKIMNEPSLDRSVKKIILSFIDGDTEGAIEAAKRYFKNNPQIMEMTRSQLASNSEMAEMMGLTDVINDKKKWEEAINDGFDVFGSLKNLGSGSDALESGDVEADGEITQNSRRNKFASAAA